MLNMQKMQQKVLDFFLLEDPSPAKLRLFGMLIARVIPFNHPHNFQFVRMSDDVSLVKIPLKKNNLNHLGGIHACAIATLGELTSGVLILKNFKMTEYRLILSKLNVEYFYQGKTELRGEAHFSAIEKEQVKEDLTKNEKVLIPMETIVYDDENNQIAKVKTLWQLKNWKMVKTKTL